MTRLDLRTAILALGMLACNADQPAAAPAPPDAAVEATARTLLARVNGVPLYEDQLRAAVERGVRKYRRVGLGAGRDRAVALMTRKALEQAIDDELLAQAAADEPVEDLDARTEEALARSRQQSAPGEAAIPEADRRPRIHRALRVEAYLARMKITEPDISDAEVRAYYDQNPGRFARPDGAHVRHVLAAVQKDGPPDVRAAARRKIDAARAALRRGEPFESVAEAMSDCNSAPDGGDLSFISPGFMPEPFERAAFSLPIGQLSEVISTEHGFHVLEVLERKSAGPAPLEELEDFIRRFMQERASRARRAEHLQHLRTTATLEILKP